MMRVRIDGGQLSASSCARSPASAPSSAATSPTSPTGRTCSSTGSASRTSRRSGAGSRPSGCRRPRPAATPRGSCSAARWPAILEDEVIDATDVHRRDGREVRRQPRVQQPAAQVEDLDVGLRRPLHRATRSTTSSFVGVRERRPARPATTCGSAAACRPTRCSPSGSASSSGPTRSPTSGRRAPSIFRDYGYRRQRNHARMKFLMADWGPEKFRQVLQDEYLHAAAARRPGARRPPSTTSATTSASASRRTAPTPSGSRCAPAGSAAACSARVADLAERVRRRAGSGRRPSRSWSSSTCPTRRSRTSSPRWPSTTCWSARAPSAAAPWPAPAWSSASWRSSRPSSTPRTSTPSSRSGCPTSTSRSAINVNGCPNSCARFQTADIGFKGSMVRDDERRDGRGLPGAPGRPPRRRGRLRPQVPRPQGDQGRDGRLLRARAPRLPRAPRARRAFAAYVARADEAWLL